MKMIRFIRRHWETIWQGSVFMLYLILACGIDGVVDLLFSLF